MRIKLTVLSIKRRALKLIPEDGIFICEGDTFCGYTEKCPDYLNLRFAENEAHDPTNFVAFGKVQHDDGYIVTTKLGKFAVEEIKNETVGSYH